MPAWIYNSVPLIRENILHGKKSTCRRIQMYCPCCCKLEKDGGETDCRGKHSFSKLKRSQAGFSSLYSSVLLCFWKMMEQRTGCRLNLNPVLNSSLNVFGVVCLLGNEGMYCFHLTPYYITTMNILLYWKAVGCWPHFATAMWHSLTLYWFFFFFLARENSICSSLGAVLQLQK